MSESRPRSSGLVSIVVPTYKEAENIPVLIKSITEVMGQSRWEYEIILVDDNSGDGTEEIVRQLARQGVAVRIFVRPKHRGFTAAVLYGFSKVNGDYLVSIGADLSNPPSAIPEMLDILEKDEAEFVLGSGNVPGGTTEEGWKLSRRLNIKVAALLARPFVNIKDPMSGFFALPRVVYKRAESLYPIGCKAGLELLVKCRCKNICEIPIHSAKPRQVASKHPLREQADYLRQLKHFADFKFGTFSRLCQFCFVGGTGMFVDLIIYAILLIMVMPLIFTGIAGTLSASTGISAKYITLGVARGIAIWVAISWNFWLNRRVTFSYSRGLPFIKLYLKFLLSCTFGAVLSWLVALGLSLETAFFSEHLLLAAVIGIVIGTACNFVLSMSWVFKHKAASPPVEVKNDSQANSSTR